ncbi:stage II sporulation protein R [Parageobacillus thermoglucosidasius]|uniref:Stage II sporulation protein R n=1 Tax=Parageobacillus thermoglucosidasius TaxID=1426 RepID=A0AB38QXE0_PARTM|nr:stage II sporulation protein R [Parageobacillus thermoglucosidasius]UOE76481.1 stage II sporulation protein R [Parageobacillus thermoglucosidasius]GCD84481.1 stage II sporulation protein R [Parageobacillus thermoglucosidasius]
MKRNNIAIVLYILLFIFGVLVNVYGQQTKAGANATVAVPDEAIRLRILANSDSAEDQALKRKVRDAVNAQINGWVADLTSFQEAKRVIRSHLPEIEQTVADVLRKEHSDQSYKVQFEKVDFPTKIYGDYVYPAGRYDAILITLGDGKGANWWCVLFPPLCFLDFGNSDAVQMDEHPYAMKKGTGQANVQEREEKGGTANIDEQQKQDSAAKEAETEQVPPFVEESEQPVEIKFFVKELIDRWIP